jgi:hypothetical protein
MGRSIASTTPPMAAPGITTMAGSTKALRRPIQADKVGLLGLRRFILRALPRWGWLKPRQQGQDKQLNRFKIA